MPKPSSYPTLYDEVLQLNISRLKDFGYLEPDQSKSGTLTWSSTNWGGIKEDRGRIGISLNMAETRPYIELNYKYGDEPRKYKVMLVSIPSNLGRGRVWYFLCPKTYKRCRKLYSIGGYFLHREAFKGCMYESQTKSKKYRAWDNSFGVHYEVDSLYFELYKKNFKKTYAGKPTKRYLKLIAKIKQAEGIPYHNIEKLLLTN